MPSSDLSHWLLLAQRLFHDLVALLCVPSTRFGHLFPPAGSPAFLWPSYSHLSRVPNLMGRDSTYGSIPHVILKQALSSYGMNPEKDITVLAMGGSGDRLAALTAGAGGGAPPGRGGYPRAR